MTRHLLKLVWNRKRSNLLIAVEILLSFIVLAAVTTLAVFYADNYRKPLGFEVDGIWTISVIVINYYLCNWNTSKAGNIFWNAY